MISVSKINEVSNSVKSMPLISHLGAPVVTTDMLADAYATEVINIQVNYSRNKNRFIEGKHFHKLTGSILKEFKNWLTNSKLVYKGSELVSKHTKSIVLWTERGAARHAKMLDTDRAWDVFEVLEDFYFVKKQESKHKSTVSDRSPLVEAINLLVGKKAIAYSEAWRLVHHKFNVSSVDDLTTDDVPVAIEYVHRLALEGEYIPKEEKLPCNVKYPSDGRLLLTFNHGAVEKSEVIEKDCYVLNLDVFLELAQKAGYLVAKREDIANHLTSMPNRW